MEQQKIYLLPGDVVKLKQNLDYAPRMIIVKKITKTMKGQPEFLQGMLCKWFTIDGKIQEAIFSTKDLIKL